MRAGALNAIGCRENQRVLGMDKKAKPPSFATRSKSACSRRRKASTSSLGDKRALGLATESAWGRAGSS